MPEATVTAWADATSRVGETIGATRGPDEVTAADIRRKLEVIGLDCPLHYDEECARSFGYRTIVSPVSMTRTWAISPTWSPGHARPRDEVLRTLLPSAQLPGAGDTVIATTLGIEHHEPLHPGDRVAGTAVLESVTPKTTRVGRGAFISITTTYVNQRDEIVSVERASVFRFDRGQSDTGDAEASSASDTAATPAGHAPVGPPPAAVVRGRRDARDVAIGDQLPEFVVPITLQRLVMEAGANRDFSPWHFDAEVARASGAPALYANTTFVETLLEAAVRCWGRLNARIRSLHFTMKANTCVGLARVGGVVSGTAFEHGQQRTTLDLWIDTPRGRTVMGTAVVALIDGDGR
jgi:acyl dehydratase